MLYRHFQPRVGTVIVAVAVLLVVGVFVAEAILQPLNRDLGVFAYTGRVILQGGMPYVDSWDHKGPITYLLDAAGLAVTLNNLAGVYLLEGIFLGASLFVSYRLWTGIITPFWAGIAAFGFVITYFNFYIGGNLTETWLLPFSLFTYSIYARYVLQVFDDATAPRLSLMLALSVSIGLSIAVALLTRVNNAAGLLVAALALFIVDRHHRFKALAMQLLVFLAVSAPALAWLYFNGAWASFIDQYWHFNILYSSQSDIAQRLACILSIAKQMAVTPCGIGLVILVVVGPFTRLSATTRGWKYTLGIFLLVSFADVAAASSSGRSYRHYAVVSIAPLTLLSVLLPTRVEQFMAAFGVRDVKKLVAILATVGIFAVSTASAMRFPYSIMLEGSNMNSSTPGKLKRYLSKNTESDDCVLVHGNETWLLVVADRSSVTRYIYVAPVDINFSGAYKKYIAEVVRGRPKYIVSSPKSCGIGKRRCQDDKLFAELRSFMKQNYMYEKKIGGFRFWRRTTAGPTDSCGPPY